MTFGYKDNFHFRAIRKEDEKKVRNIIFSILKQYQLELDTEGVDADLFDIVDYYKNGLFGVVELGDTQEVVGSFALYPLDDHTMELRKMYLLPEYRGQGVGKWIISFCEAYAQRSGYRKISLETASVLKEAVGLYQKMGYKPSCDENHTERCDILLEKELLPS